MGFQTYCIAVVKGEDVETIVEVLKRHNNEENYDLVGEEIMGCQVTDISNPYKRGPFGRCQQIVSCYNLGGRSYTRSYLFHNLPSHLKCRVMDMTDSLRKRLSKDSTPITLTPDETV